MARQKVLGPLPKYIDAVTEAELDAAMAGAGGGGGGQTCEMSTETAYRAALQATTANGNNLTVNSHTKAQLAYPAFGDLVRHTISVTPTGVPGPRNVNIGYSGLYEVNEGYDAVPCGLLVLKTDGTIVASGMRYNGSQIQCYFQADAVDEDYTVTALVIVSVTNKCDD